MLRRVHTPRLRTGEIALDPAASRHLRNVLRLTEGTTVEVFDDAGATAQGEIVRLAPEVTVRIDALNVPSADRAEMIIASAVPKGDRADWMIEKLSELGCTRFIPLATARSVVHPEGKNKRDRWTRLATESAKQSRRSGVMRIDELTPLRAALDEAAGGAVAGGAGAFVLSTDPSAMPIASALSAHRPGGLRSTTLFIGPEGGWTEEEIAMFESSGVRGLKLTQTILRIETAAVATAAVVAALMAATRRRRRTTRPGRRDRSPSACKGRQANCRRARLLPSRDRDRAKAARREPRPPAVSRSDGRGGARAAVRLPITATSLRIANR